MTGPQENVFGWIEVGIAFNGATSLFALPLYLHLYASPGALELVRLAFLVQILPTVVFVVIGRALSSRPGLAFLRRVYWLGLAVATFASFARLVQVQYALGLPGIPDAAKIAIPVLIVALLVVLAVARTDWLARGFGRVGPIFALVSAVFIGQLLMSGSLHASPPLTVPRRDDSVFLFVFDELGRDVLLRDGEIDPTRFPNLAALASDGISIGDATSNYSDTCQSIPSMLTGRSLPVGYCNDFFLVGQEPTLLSRLGSEYELHLYGEYLRDCKDQSAYVCRGVPYLIASRPELKIAQHLLPLGLRVGPVAGMLGETWGAYTLPLWNTFMEDVRRGPVAGRAYFMHLLLPHAPYVFDRDGSSLRSPYRYFRGDDNDDLAYKNYERQIMFVDSLFGSFVAELRQRDVYSKATIVITGDHGPALLPPPGPVLQGVNIQSPDVPLLIKSPRLAPRRISADYQHIDYAATVLDVLGLAPTWTLEGRSAIREGIPPRPKSFFSGGHIYRRDASGTWRSD